MRPTKPSREQQARALLERLEAPVEYDVERGLGRHQQRVARQGELPAWARPKVQSVRVRLSRWLLAASALGWLGASGAWVFGRGVEPGLRDREPRSAEAHEAASQAAARAPAHAEHGHDGAGPREDAHSAQRETAPTGMHGSGAPGMARASRAFESPGSTVAAVVGTEEETAGPLSGTAGRVHTRARKPVPASSEQTKTHTTRPAGVQGSDLAAAGRRAFEPDPPFAAVVSPERQARAPAPGGASASAGIRAERPLDGEEVLQLARAEALLRRDPASALALVRKGHTQFKPGYLQHERRYLEIAALFALARVGEAHAHAQWFLRDYPNSAYRAQIAARMDAQPLP
jgi:hypothetical protein